MEGIFTTRKYDRAGQLQDVLVSRNRFTAVGMEWMWRSMSGQADSHLGQARIAVGDGNSGFSFGDTALAGENTAAAALDAGPAIRRAVTEDIAGVEIILAATFGERDGVFDWAERGVVTADGVLLDRAVADQGRKPLGVIWTVEAVLRLES